MNKTSDFFTLGHDFWNYRAGQAISMIGDACGHIALAWWILDKTGSAAKMSVVMAPAMVVRIILMPLLGPFGDKFSRKHLIIVADLWRFFLTLILAGMAYFNIYNQALLIVLFILISLGSALFMAASGGIVPQLVPRDKLQSAMQQSQATMSIANIIGSVIGGIAVSSFGVISAFFVDALSYFIAGICTMRIRASTVPDLIHTDRKLSAMAQWFTDLKGGFQILFRIPLLFWLCILAMLINLAFSPMPIVMPVLVKTGRAMPAWFLGALEGSVSLGVVVGSLSITHIRRRLKSFELMVIAIALMGAGTMVLPWIPNILLPLVVLFTIGLSQACANIPLGTQMSLTIPDHFRGRIFSIMGFMCSGMSPIGIAAVGGLISWIGLNSSLMLMGALMLALTPFLFLIPNLKSFLDASTEESKDFFHRYYPGIF